MRRKFYLHRRGGVFYACPVNQETGLSMGDRSTGKRDRDAALIDIGAVPSGKGSVGFVRLF
jgi:hypothetical protein